MAIKRTTIGIVILLASCGGTTPPAQPQPRATAAPTASQAPPADTSDGGADQGDAGPIVAAPDAKPHGVARVQVASSAIAVDDSQIYYFDEGDGSLNAVAPSGGTRTTLYTSPGTMTGTPYLTQDSQTLYFEAKAQLDNGGAVGTVFRFDKGGDQPQKLGDNLKDDFHGIAVDPTNVYFVAGHIIYKVPVKGGPLPTAASGSGNDPTSLALDSDSIYWTTDGTIFKASKSGGGPRLLIGSQPASTNIQLDATSIYWVSGGTKLMKADKSGTGPTLVIQADSPIADYAIDGTKIYFATKGIMKVATTGGAAETVVEDAHTPLGIAVDPSNIYWAAKGTDAKQWKDGQIMVKAR